MSQSTVTTIQICRRHQRRQSVHWQAAKATAWTSSACSTRTTSDGVKNRQAGLSFPRRREPSRIRKLDSRLRGNDGLVVFKQPTGTSALLEFDGRRNRQESEEGRQ